MINSFVYTMLIGKIYYLRSNIILRQYLPRDEEVSLPELEKVGRAWVAALVMIPGPCMDSKGLFTTNVTLS